MSPEAQRKKEEEEKKKKEEEEKKKKEEEERKKKEEEDKKKKEEEEKEKAESDKREQALAKAQALAQKLREQKLVKEEQAQLDTIVNAQVLFFSETSKKTNELTTRHTTS